MTFLVKTTTLKSDNACNINLNEYGNENSICILVTSQNIKIKTDFTGILICGFTRQSHNSE